MNKGVALVLGGGGGKGAYQIGVWKALRELDVEPNITAVAGTSVGALNALLFATGDYELAESIWSNLSKEQILTPKTLSEYLGDIMGKSTSQIANIIQSRIKPLVGTVEVSVLPLIALNIARFLFQTGSFSRSGLSQLIEQNRIAEQTFQSGIDIYAVCASLPKLQLHTFHLNDYTSDVIKDIVLASSAIPGVFPPQKIGRTEYYDGGLCNNYPYDIEAIKEYKAIISVPLSVDDGIKRLEKSDNPIGTKIIEILPSKHLGSFIEGTLDFSADGARKRIDLGYRDTIANLRLAHQHWKTEKKIQQADAEFWAILQKADQIHKESVKRRIEKKRAIYEMMRWKNGNED